MPQAYHRLLYRWGVSAPFGEKKEPFGEKKEGGPRFSEDLPVDSIVLQQLLHQVILQR